MRIYYVTQAPFDNPGAESTHATEVIRNLVRAGVEVTVLHSSHHASVQSLGAREWRAPWIGLTVLRRIWFQCWLCWSLWRHRAEADAIYVRHAALMIVPALLRHVLRMPIVGEFNTLFARKSNARHIPFLFTLLRLIERRALKAYDRIIVISAALSALIQETYGVPPQCLEVIRNGTNLDLMRPLPKEECRRSLTLPRDAFVIAFVGHLHRWQGVAPLIEAIALLQDSADQEIHLVIAGTSEHLGRFQASAATLGVKQRVHFLGSVSYEKIPEVISASDVAVAPGDASESIDYVIRSPLKVYEYLACGRPVVAGKLDTLVELFSGDPVGFLVTPGSVPDLVVHLNILRRDAALADRMGTNARRLAERSLSWASAAERLIRVLKSLTGKPVSDVGPVVIALSPGGNRADATGGNGRAREL
jgi:glycosyltransferase involved in cell wall biosynthesis